MPTDFEPVPRRLARNTIIESRGVRQQSLAAIFRKQRAAGDQPRVKSNGCRESKARKSGSHLTPRWREMDSNLRFPNISAPVFDQPVPCRTTVRRSRETGMRVRSICSKEGSCTGRDIAAAWEQRTPPICGSPQTRTAESAANLPRSPRLAQRPHRPFSPAGRRRSRRGWGLRPIDCREAGGESADRNPAHEAPARDRRGAG